MSMSNEKAKEEATKLNEALATIMPKADIPLWLRCRNLYFGGKTPLEVITKGGLSKVWEMVKQQQIAKLDEQLKAASEPSNAKK